MTLEEWQERLERHFENLARLREGSGFPIFALEHGLNDEEIRKNLVSTPFAPEVSTSIESILASLGNLCCRTWLHLQR